MTPALLASLRLRPISCTPDAWEAAGVPPAVMAALDTLWSRRAVPWSGESPEERRVWGEIWADAAGLSDLDGIRRWAASVRLAVWGDERPWAEQGADCGLAESRQRWARARRVLGPPLAAWLADDGWATDVERWAQADDGRWSAASLQRDAQQRRRERRIHARPEGHVRPSAVVAAAQSLCARFGLTHLQAAGDMLPEEVMAAVRQAEEGIGVLARTVSWQETEIGARRLGLAFELEPHPAMAACIEPLTNTIILGRCEGWGSFGHEWAHALDLSLARVWDPSDLPRTRHKYGSDMAEDWAVWVPPSHEDLRQKLRHRDDGPDGASASAVLFHRVLDVAPMVLLRWSDEAPAVWKGRVAQRLHALAAWVASAKKPGMATEKLNLSWQQWRFGNRIAWSHPDTTDTRAWRDRWERLESAMERLLLGPPLKRQAWAEWAAAKDAVEPEGYRERDVPHERFARSFHAFLRETVGSDTWAAGPIDQPDRFPDGLELEAHMAWWPSVLPALRACWIAQPDLAVDSAPPVDVAARPRHRIL